MRITAQDEYGLRCLVQIASQPPGQNMNAHEIAKKEGISLPYANKILNTLKKKGLVESIRGIKGGFRLIRDKKDITVGEVMEALNQTLFPPEFCNWYSGQESKCVHYKGSCCIRPMWSMLSDHIVSILKQISFDDIVGKKEEIVGQDIRKRIEPKLLSIQQKERPVMSVYMKGVKPV